MSSSRRMTTSSPPTFISVPAYFPKRILSPFFTASLRSDPSSSNFPSPTASTFPSSGFSFADSGMMIPPLVFSSDLSLVASIRSYRGLSAIVVLLLTVFYGVLFIYKFVEHSLPPSAQCGNLNHDLLVVNYSSVDEILFILHGFRTVSSYL